MMLRALNATRYVRKTGEVHAIQCGSIRSGFVWNHIDRSDDEWKARAMAEPIPSMHLPLPVIRIGGQAVTAKGMVRPDYDEAKATAHFKGREVVLDVDVGVGKGAAKVWTCDLTHGSIAINADYRS